VVCCIGSVGTAFNSSSEGLYQEERRDFDDGANALWSLYGKEAKSHDEARFLSLAADMDGVLLFVSVNLHYHDRDLTSGVRRLVYFLLFSLPSLSKAFSLCK
jgi:hypothetical protein